MVGEDERHGPGRPARRSSDGHQDVGRKSRPTHKASDDQSVGDIVPNPCSQDCRKVICDRPQDGKGDGSRGQDGRRQVAEEEGDDSAGQVGKAAGEGHDRPAEPGGGRPHRADKEDGTGQGVAEQAHRPVHLGGTATKRPTKVSAKTTATTDVAIAVPRDSEWTTRELAQIRAQLVAQLSEMQSEYNQSLIELDELQSSSTDGAGDDQADAGSKTFEREQELSIAANRLDLLTQIKRAVERIDAGTYGYCESCGKPIPKARLKAFPMATLDVACKQREERR